MNMLYAIKSFLLILVVTCFSKCDVSILNNIGPGIYFIGNSTQKISIAPSLEYQGSIIITPVYFIGASFRVNSCFFYSQSKLENDFFLSGTNNSFTDVNKNLIEGFLNADSVGFKGINLVLTGSIFLINKVQDREAISLFGPFIKYDFEKVYEKKESKSGWNNISSKDFSFGINYLYKKIYLTSHYFIFDCDFGLQIFGLTSNWQDNGKHQIKLKRFMGPVFDLSLEFSVYSQNNISIILAPLFRGSMKFWSSNQIYLDDVFKLPKQCLSSYYSLICTVGLVYTS